MKFKFLLSILIFAGFNLNATEKPTVALVLSGGGAKGIAQQGGHRHGADTAGNRSEQSCALLSSSEVNVADQASVIETGDADINHNSALLDPIALDQSGFSYGHAKHVRIADIFLEIP